MKSRSRPGNCLNDHPIRNVEHVPFLSELHICQPQLEECIFTGYLISAIQCPWVISVQDLQVLTLTCERDPTHMSRGFSMFNLQTPKAIQQCQQEGCTRPVKVLKPEPMEWHRQARCQVAGSTILQKTRFQQLRSPDCRNEILCAHKFSRFSIYWCHFMRKCSLVRACLSLLVGRLSVLFFLLPNAFDSKPESNFKGNKT